MKEWAAMGAEWQAIGKVQGPVKVHRKNPLTISLKLGIKKYIQLDGQEPTSEVNVILVWARGFVAKRIQQLTFRSEYLFLRGHLTADPNNPAKVRVLATRYVPLPSNRRGGESYTDEIFRRTGKHLADTDIPLSDFQGSLGTTKKY